MQPLEEHPPKRLKRNHILLVSGGIRIGQILGDHILNHLLRHHAGGRRIKTPYDGNHLLS